MVDFFLTHSMQSFVFIILLDFDEPLNSLCCVSHPYAETTIELIVDNQHVCFSHTHHVNRHSSTALFQLNHI